MPKRRPPSNEVAAPLKTAAAATYAPVLNAGFQATASHVQAMHQAISGKTFDSLIRVPGLSVPTRIVQGVHDAITLGVYAAVRHAGGAALSMAAGAERLAIDPARIPGTTEQAVRSALNAVVGDMLSANGSALAVSMSLHAHGKPMAVTPASMATLEPRVCVFIHGLACDERSWSLRSDAWAGSVWADLLPSGKAPDYGALLEHELGVSAIYLRYNTGLSIDNNARQLADLLERIAQAAPKVREWLPIGHSMGGLIARRAHAIAAADRYRWAGRTPTIVCLGSPHQGAPLEKLGHVAAAALNSNQITRPLGRIADMRSQGIKDLRTGLALPARRSAKAAGPALRLLFATLGDEADALMGPLIGKLFGDGLVMAGSGADIGSGGDVERVEVAGLGHMSLLNHPRVYASLRRWLGAPAD